MVLPGTLSHWMQSKHVFNEPLSQQFDVDPLGLFHELSFNLNLD